MHENVSFFPDIVLVMWEITPNPGRIRMYTSGCPKNQNRCWNRMGSPPPDGSKKDVFQLRSVSSIVIAPASTGKARISRNVVMRILHLNSGICSIFIPLGGMFMIDTMKLSDLRIDEIPAKCREKMVKSMEDPWNGLLDRGG